ncbi:hypothetical protein RUND412_001353 [Rhizina undulata]
MDSQDYRLLSCPYSDADISQNSDIVVASLETTFHMELNGYELPTGYLPVPDGSESAYQHYTDDLDRADDRYHYGISKIETGDVIDDARILKRKRTPEINGSLTVVPQYTINKSLSPARSIKTPVSKRKSGHGGTSHTITDFPGSESVPESNGSKLGRPKKRPRVESSNKLLVCPFEKNPSYKSADNKCGYSNKEPRRVKEHILSAHLRHLQCDKCGIRTGRDNYLNKVHRRKECSKKINFELVGEKTLAMAENLVKLKLIGRTKEETWQTYYMILFPSTEKGDIPSPYFEDDPIHFATTGAPENEHQRNKNFSPIETDSMSALGAGSSITTNRIGDHEENAALQPFTSAPTPRSFVSTNSTSIDYFATRASTLTYSLPKDAYSPLSSSYYAWDATGEMYSPNEYAAQANSAYSNTGASLKWQPPEWVPDRGQFREFEMGSRENYWYEPIAHEYY